MDNRISDQTQTVRVLFFAGVREAAGAAEATFELPEPMRASDVIDAVVHRSPAVKPLRGSLLVAVDECYARRTDVVPAGAVVALFPPVSGG